MRTLRALLIFCLTLAMAGSAVAQDIHPEKSDFKAPKKEYSPYVEDYLPTIDVYFGDTHLTHLLVNGCGHGWSNPGSG